MFHFKQTAKLTLCALLTASVFTAVGCGSGTNSSSPEAPTCLHEWSEWTETLAPTCTTEGERERVCAKDPTHIETESIAIDPDAHDFGEWSMLTAPTCTTVGVKQRVCSKDSAHIEQENYPALGHAFDNGVCGECQEGPIFPAAPTTIKYVNPRKTSGIVGTGAEYDRFQLTVGYYEIEIASNGSTWMAFSIPEAGQYALYTTENPDGVTLTRYDASSQYVSTAYDSRALGDGNYYASVNCGTQYYNAEWRATFAVHGVSGEKVKLRFVKIGEPQWAPSYVYENEYAKEINGTVAPEGEASERLKAVAYDASYFYDETVGYYRLGTKTEPGKIIFAAITANAPRVFSDAALTDVYMSGGNYKVYHSRTIEGNYLVKDYGWFLLSNGGMGTMDENRNFIPDPADPTANCYENFVNSDGMYPVNKELHEFLVLYTQSNTPLDLNGTSDPSTLANAWLAFCFTYDALKEGTKDLPIEQGVGQFEITTKNKAYTYYTIKHENTNAASPVTYCNITATAAGALLHVNGYTYGTDGNGFSVNIETDAATGTTLYIGTVNGEKATFTVTVSEVTTGTAANPTVIPFAGAVTLTTQEFITKSGEKIYEGYYAYTVDREGTLSLSTEPSIPVMLGDSYSSSMEIEFEEGESSTTVIIYLSSTDAPITVNGQLTFEVSLIPV